MDNPRFQVFLSHNKADWQAVQQLAQRLEEQAIAVWRDEWSQDTDHDLERRLFEPSLGTGGSDRQTPSAITRIDSRIAELTENWKLASEKLACLEKAKTLATQADERFRLEHEIVETGKQCDGIEQELRELEEQRTSTLTPPPEEDPTRSALDACGVCLICIGAQGVGPWRSEAARVVVERRLETGDLRIIPILLPGGRRDERSRLPQFLVSANWLHFRPDFDNSVILNRLIEPARATDIRPEPPAGEDICPYRGLQTFQVEHAAYFFGREALTEWLLEELQPGSDGARENRFLAIIGASGSGKSSLARAGLIPALQRGGLESSAQWPVVICRPGTNPLESLAVALAAHPAIQPGVADVGDLIDRMRDDRRRLHLSTRLALHGRPDEQRVVVLVDQFEEIFTRCDDDALRRALIDNLLFAANEPTGRTVVTLTMRADFFGKCAPYDTLAAALSDHQILVGPMNEDELRRAIELPANKVGCELEPGLVEMLLQAVKERPGSLPLLQHTLMELWRRRAGNLLTIAAYNEIGRLEGALEQQANRLFAGLSEAEQSICERIFLRLTQPGEGTEDTKRRAARKELGESETIEAVLQKLVEARLITTEGDKEPSGEGFVEVSHEALIRGWSKIAEWIEGKRSELRIQHRLSEAAKEWEEQGRDEAYLYRGARLAEAEEWSQLHEDVLSPFERAFLEESTALRDRLLREAEEQRQRELTLARQAAEAEAKRASEAERRRQEQAQATKRQRRLTGLVGVLGGIAVILALVAFERFMSAENALGEAVHQLARTNWITGINERDENDDYLKASHYFMRAAELTPNPFDAKNARIAGFFLAGDFHLNVLIAHKSEVRGAQFSADESRILTWSDDGTARVWDSQTGAALTPALAHKSAVRGAQFSADESRILTWSTDGTARVWDSDSGEALTPALAHKDGVSGAQFSADESRILTWSEDGTARVWDSDSGEALTPALAHKDAVVGAQFSADESRILTWSTDGTARVWDSQTGAALTPALAHKSEVRGAQFSADESRILTWSDDGTARVWDSQTGATLTPALAHKDGVRGAQFSADESRILTWSYDGTARVWDSQTGVALTPALAHKDVVRGAQFSADESRILTWSSDGTARVWDSQTGAALTPALAHKSEVRGAQFSADESRILTWSDDGTARVWDSQTGAALTAALAHKDAVWGAQFSADESWILTWSSDGTARVWDSQTGAALTPALAHKDAVRGAQFSADESRILTWSRDGTARVWDSQTGATLTPALAHQDVVWGAQFSADESRILTWSSDGTARVWDSQTGATLTPALAHQDVVWGAQFSADESRILTWSSDGTARVWDSQTGVALTPALAHQDAVWGAQFSADESRILTWSSDGTARVWDSQTGVVLTAALAHKDAVWGAQFSADESRILTWSYDGTARVWDSQTGVALTPALAHQSAVRGAQFSADESRILTWSIDGTARVWDSQTGAALTAALAHKDAVRGAQFSADESRILTWSYDGTARVWDSQTGVALTPALAHKDVVRGAQFSADESRILTWSDDGTARVWDSQTGAALTPALAHQSAVWGAQFSADESWILTWSSDGTARVWDSQTGAALTPALAHKDGVWGAQFSADESRILTWSSDGTARLWNFPIDDDVPKKKLILYLELNTGTRLTDFGELQVLSPEEWWKLKKELRPVK